MRRSISQRAQDCSRSRIGKHSAARTSRAQQDRRSDELQSARLVHDHLATAHSTHDCVAPRGLCQVPRYQEALLPFRASLYHRLTLLSRRFTRRCRRLRNGPPKTCRADAVSWPASTQLPTRGPLCLPRAPRDPNGPQPGCSVWRPPAATTQRTCTASATCGRNDFADISALSLTMGAPRRHSGCAQGIADLHANSCSTRLKTSPTPQETTTTTMIPGLAPFAMTPTTPSIRRRITTRTTASPTIPLRTTRARIARMARPLTTTGKTTTRGDP